MDLFCGQLPPPGMTALCNANIARIYGALRHYSAPLTRFKVIVRMVLQYICSQISTFPGLVGGGLCTGTGIRPLVASAVELIINFSESRTLSGEGKSFQ